MWGKAKEVVNKTSTTSYGNGLLGHLDVFCTSLLLSLFMFLVNAVQSVEQNASREKSEVLE